ncbi:MAG: R3H domain-containing nucleic acid-binding protein [Mycoplasmatota bacterium]
MIEKYVFEGKTLEKTYEICLETLNCRNEDIYVLNAKEETKILKGKKQIITVVKKYDVKQYIKEFILGLCAYLDIEPIIEVRDNKEILNINIVSENNNYLIGKEGKTLNSIQLLLKKALLQQNIMIKFNIDASNYKEKQQQNLLREVEKIIKEVQKTKIDVKLDPMNSYERRLIHSLVVEKPNVESVSEGQGNERFITIKYKEN